MEDLMEDLSKKAAPHDEALRRAARTERRLAEIMPTEADATLARIKAEFIELLRENNTQQSRRHGSWGKKLLVLILVMVGAAAVVIAREARDIG
jgi:uncharacterized membrane protein YcjF (UPF0283 family)